MSIQSVASLGIGAFFCSWGVSDFKNKKPISGFFKEVVGAYFLFQGLPYFPISMEPPCFTPLQSPPILYRLPSDSCAIAKRPLERRIVAIGDVHGSYNGLIALLQKSRLINSFRNWSGGSSTFVQIGDVVDRGPDSEKCWNFLDQLQQQAKKTGGKVVRLLGNHELWWVQGKTESCGPSCHQKTFREKIIRDVLDHKVHAAATFREGGLLFSHAGFMPEILKSLKTTDYHKAAESANHLLRDSIKRNRFDHPLFQASAHRGGSAPEGGIFWADFQELREQTPSKIIQIVGHTPPHCKAGFDDCHPIRATSDLRAINIDGGLLERYGGNLAYLEIHRGHVFTHTQKQGFWETEDLAAHCR